MKDEELIKILRLDRSSNLDAYAADRLESLTAEIKRLKEDAYGDAMNDIHDWIGDYRKKTVTIETLTEENERKDKIIAELEGIIQDL